MGRASDTRSIGMNDLEKDQEIERLKKRVAELEQFLRDMDEAFLGTEVYPNTCAGIQTILAKGRPQ